MFRLITLSLGLLFLSFTPPPKFSYRVECISVNSDGTVALKIWDTKKGKGYKAHSGSIDAVHCVLYSGLSGGSCGRQNPLLNNDDAISKFENAYPEFFKKSGDYKRYVRTGALETAAPSAIADKSWKVYEVVVDRKQLQKNLTEKQIKKGLNNGF